MEAFFMFYTLKVRITFVKTSDAKERNRSK